MSTTETGHAQHAVWFTERAGVAVGAYQMAFGIRFGAGLDERLLGEACAAVVERHPALSTAVAMDGDVPVLVPAAVKIALEHGELSDERIQAEVARPFDLHAGPLARFTLLTAGPGNSLLLVVAHHLVFDGQSKDVLVRDLAAAYRAALAGDLVELAAPTAPVAADREGVAADLPRARAYWASRWSPPADPVLPGLLGVPTVAGPAGAVQVALPTDVAARIDPAARRLGVTRFELLLTAVHALLARYGNAGLPVSVALSTRTARTAGEVGLFVNELPLAVTPLRGTVRAYAQEVRASLRELYGVRAVPLAHAVSGLRPSAALTAVSVSYRRQPTEPDFPGVPSTVDWWIPAPTARNVLNLLVVDTADGLRIALHHSLEAMPADAAQRLGEHLTTALASIMDDEDQPVATVPILPPGEEHRVVREWNDTTRPYPPGSTLPALLAASVRAGPDRVAVVDGERVLTYAELDAAVTRLAATLRARGVGPGSLVGVCLPRSWWSLTLLLAVARCGAAYVPVDPAYPAARRSFILAHAAPALVVTDAADLATTEDPLPDPAHATAPGDVAYLMYTSGSTGAPKGVAVSHGALANLLLGMRDLLGSRPTDRWLALTSLSFDISGLELYLPLIVGGRVVIAPEGAATDGARLHRLIRDQRVTHVQATPSGWRILLDGGFDGGAGMVALAGGEALPLPLARELRPRVARLFNVYGPTETTIWSTADEIAPDADQVTIGRPIANTRAYVLDQALRPVPVGLTGELYLAGHGIAEGYHHNPALTAERFRPDPFGSGGRLYRTGDRCAWLPDGRLVYVGRDDNQVKIRGHRVELGEIEARLLTHPGVAEAAVVLRGTRLVGYTVARGTPPEPADLRRHLAETLPAAMVPTVWSTVERMPRTPNGKLDRAALPDPPRPAPTDPAPATSAGDGGDQVVTELTAIWQDVLQVDDIGPHEDLFDLGGHSLTITRISSRIRQRFTVEVPLDAFFDTPTVAQIAQIVHRSLAAAAGGH